MKQQASDAKEKQMIKETAEVLEEILRAADKGLETLPEKERIHYTRDVQNKAKENYKQKIEDEKQF